MDNDDLSQAARGKRLRKLRNMTSLSITALAEKMDFSRVSLSNWESGHQPLSYRNAEDFLTLFLTLGVEADISWLWGGSGSEPRFTSSTDSPSLLTQTSASQSIATLSREVEVFVTGSPNAVTAKIADRLLEPLFEKGDLVGGLWKPVSGFFPPTFCIVKFDRNLLVRMISHSKNGFTITLPNSRKKDPVLFENFQPQCIAPIVRLWR